MTVPDVAPTQSQTPNGEKHIASNTVLPAVLIPLCCLLFALLVILLRRRKRSREARKKAWLGRLPVEPCTAAQEHGDDTSDGTHFVRSDILW